MGGSSGAGLLVATAVTNFLAGLILGSHQRPSPAAGAASCSATEQCLERLENGARYQLFLECGGALAAAVAVFLACAPLCGGCARGAASGVASVAEASSGVYSPPRRLAGATSSAVRAIPASALPSAGAAQEVAVEPEAPATYVPKRLKGKQGPA